MDPATMAGIGIALVCIFGSMVMDGGNPAAIISPPADDARHRRHHRRGHGVGPDEGLHVYRRVVETRPHVQAGAAGRDHRPDGGVRRASPA